MKNITIMEFLSNMNIYRVVDTGWFYGITLKIFLKKEDAIQYWENLSKHSYNNYQSYIDKAMEKVSKYDIEGHYYYALTEENLGEYLQDYIKREKEDYLYEQKEEMYKKLDEDIKRRAEQKVKQELSNKINGLLYYLSENECLNDCDYQKRKEYFWENAKKCRK